MGRPGLKQEQVFDAAEALVQAGTTPTVQAVREYLGSGSYTTINTFLAEWRAANAGRQMAEVPEMPETVSYTVRQLWATAWRTAQQGIETERQALEAARREMERERREMTGEIERLETELETAKVETVKVTEILEAERQARVQAEHQTQELRVENARLEEKASSLKVRADELHAQVEQLQGQLAELAKDRKSIDG